jgi:hypothetical protein
VCVGAKRLGKSGESSSAQLQSSSNGGLDSVVCAKPYGKPVATTTLVLTPAHFSIQAALNADESQMIATTNNRVARDDPERREVTVLFSDLVGLIKLTDADDRRELISAYRKCVADTVCRYDGGMLGILVR